MILNPYQKYTYDFYRLEQAQEVYDELINKFKEDEILNLKNSSQTNEEIKEKLDCFKADFDNKCSEIKNMELDKEKYKKNLGILILISVTTTEYLNNTFNLNNYEKSTKTINFRSYNEPLKDLLDINLRVVRKLNPYSFGYRLSLLIMYLFKLISSISIVFILYSIIKLVINITSSIQNNGITNTIIIYTIIIGIVLLFIVINKFIHYLLDKTCDYHYFKILNDCLNIRASIEEPVYNNFKLSLKVIYDELKFWKK